MPAADPHPLTAEPRRLSIHLPRPMWMGLATAVLVVVALGMQFVLPIWRQQRAILEIQRLGGRVVFEKGGPDWLRAKVGNKHMKYFDRVVNADLGMKSVNDLTLRHVAALDDLKDLVLGNSQISDDGLVYLRRLNRLEVLWLGNTRVTDAGLVHLATLRSLHDLSIANTRVSDAGLVQLRGLRSLRQLSLGNTRVTDAGIADLKRALPSLRIDR